MFEFVAVHFDAGGGDDDDEVYACACAAAVITFARVLCFIGRSSFLMFSLFSYKYARSSKWLTLAELYGIRIRVLFAYETFHVDHAWL